LLSSFVHPGNPSDPGPTTTTKDEDDYDSEPTIARKPTSGILASPIVFTVVIHGRFLTDFETLDIEWIAKDL
jgi:hypothetical protein